MQLTCENPLFFALLERPYPNSGVVTGGSKSPIVWAEAQVSDRLAMTLPGGQVVHVGLEVLDDARLVRGRQVVARMAELECADRGVVRLEDCLEIEGKAVP